MIDRAFWRDRRVLLTGHTGFKGAWLALWLERLGAEVSGLALPPDTEPALFSMLQPIRSLHSRIGDIRDAGGGGRGGGRGASARSSSTWRRSRWCAARIAPVETFAPTSWARRICWTALRAVAGLKAVLVVTTDKVYRNNGHRHAFVGRRPARRRRSLFGLQGRGRTRWSRAWRTAFFAAHGVPVATARAGNVIGGGDWSEDRLVPDIWRAVQAGKPLPLRNPQATRPWQHVLEPLAGYLRYAERLAQRRRRAAGAQLRPAAGRRLTVAEVADAMLAAMHSRKRWEQVAEARSPRRRSFLALDPALAMHSIGWRPRLDASRGPALDRRLVSRGR